MRTLFTSLLLVAVAFSAFSQESVKNRAYYLNKSKSQRTTAKILLFGGAAVLTTAIIIGKERINNDDEYGAYLIMGGTGLISMLGSVPLFMAAGRNKKKGLSMNASINYERMPVIKGAIIASRSYPAISFRVSL